MDVCAVIAVFIATSFAGILEDRAQHINNTSQFLSDESFEKTRLRRSFTISPNDTNLWPNGIVYYYLDVSSSWKKDIGMLLKQQ